MLDQHVRRPSSDRHRILMAVGAALALWLLWHGAAVVVAVLALAWLALRIRRRTKVNAIRDAGLRARADYEHHLNLHGDPRGVFGRYPPVQPGWFPDPQNPCRLRYFDGGLWTGYVTSTLGQ